MVDASTIHDELLDAAHSAMHDLAVQYLLDGSDARVLGDLRDWLTAFSEMEGLARFLLSEADRLVVTAQSA